MGLFDKFKNMLFDETEVEIPVKSNELPVRENKNVNATKKYAGFVDHSDDIEDLDEDLDDEIKEVVIPKEEIVEERKTFPIIDDFDTEEEPVRRGHSINEFLDENKVEPRRDYSKILNSEMKVNKKEERDYKKILEEKSGREISKDLKEPFKVTPVISPVFGYREETEEARQELISVPKKTVDSNTPRTFGPVSFNDTPLPVKKVVKEELVVETPRIIKEEKVIEKEEVLEEPVVTKEVPILEDETNEIEEKILNIANEVDDEDDFIIETPNYDNYEETITSGIEDEYIGNNNIEDAFEETSEYDAIDNEVSTEDVIKNTYIENDEDAHLDDTIETDLFNLIDSMYKDEDEEVE